MLSVSIFPQARIVMGVSIFAPPIMLNASNLPWLIVLSVPSYPGKVVWVCPSCPRGGLFWMFMLATKFCSGGVGFCPKVVLWTRRVAECDGEVLC